MSFYNLLTEFCRIQTTVMQIDALATFFSTYIEVEQNCAFFVIDTL
jgi:hypothetical protein